MRARTSVGIAAAALLAAASIAVVVVAPAEAAVVTGPDLSVNASADRHEISPYIYGMNFADEALAAELKLPVRRWGGNATTRYNYLYDTTNRASDWFFENIPGDNANPEQLPDGSETDRFVEQDRRTGTETILTVPLIGWAPKSRDYACGFSVEKYGPQESTDQWRPDCGNGKRPDGTLITGNDPHDTSVEIGPEYVRDWIGHLNDEYGGVKFYNLDNEPDIWHQTHRDVHPAGASSAELRDQTYAIAAAVKAADPDAATLGPVGWGWSSWDFSGLDQEVCGRTGCWSDPPDRAARDGLPSTTWYLRQMQAYEQEHGTRILDYFDMHFYPQASGVAFGNASDPETNALRLRSTRALWDPAYTDESWINTEVRLIPRMTELVAAEYPGTKTAITEYNWGALDSINGALTQADVLGIFGREGLDLAALWGPPSADQPGAYAFRMFRNYDGAGGQFGETSIRATSADQDQLSVYAAERAGDRALTIMVVNKSGQELRSNLSIRSAVNGVAQVYQYGAADPTGIVRQPDVWPTQAPSPGPCPCLSTLNYTFPADSVTLFVAPQRQTPPPPPVQCRVNYSPSYWTGGMNANIVLTNTGTTAVNGWTQRFNFSGRLEYGWGARWSQEGDVLTAVNESWNGVIASGAQAYLGFGAATSGGNSSPTTFTLNGAACST